MACWAWMKGVDDVIADPIAPVDANDARPSVKDLIEDHRKTICEIKSDLEKDPLYSPHKHDDLWILRFVLSHKSNSKVATQAAKTTLLFRQEHKLDEEDIRAFPAGKENTKCGSLTNYLKYCTDMP